MERLEVDISLITITVVEKIQVVVNGILEFDYDHKKNWLQVLIPGANVLDKKLIFDAYEIQISNVEELQRYALDYWLNHQEKIQDELSQQQSKSRLEDIKKE